VNNGKGLAPVDLQTLVGLFAATGIPALVKAVIGWIHPSLVTLLCPPINQVIQAACYTDDRWEAGITLAITALGIAYMLYTMYWRLKLNATPPPGTTSALVETGSVPITVPVGPDGTVAAKLNTETGQITQTPLESPAPPGKSP